MTNNDVLRSIRYMLNITDSKLIEIAALADCRISKEEVVAFLKRDDEEGYVACPHEVMGHFLDGLIYFKRGKDETRPPMALEVPITNNIVLKKIRVAFELKDTDIIATIKKNGLNVSKAEIGSFFRKPDHRNYRDCGDQFLRNLLKGLTP